MSMSKKYIILFCVIYLGVFTCLEKLGSDKKDTFNINDMHIDTEQKNVQIETIDSKKSIEEILENAEKFWKDKEYKNAINELENSEYSNETIINETIEKYKEEFRNEIEMQAEKKYAEGEYKSAVDVVENGLEVLQEDLVLQELKEYYEEAMPVNLFDVSTLINEVGDWAFLHTNVKDNVGVIHESAWQIVASSFGDAESITFILDKKYKTLKGNLVLSEVSKSSKLTAYLEFVGDGKVLGVTETLTAGVRPIEFEIDVSEVRDLKIIPRYATGLGWSSIFIYTDGIWLYK